MLKLFIAKFLSFATLGFLVIIVSCNSAFAFGKSNDLISNVEPYKAPEITGINQWFNSKPLTLESLRGKVVLVDFWTYSCINCIRTLPHMNALQEKYASQGLVIIGIHAPEFDFEKSAANVEAAIKKFHIKYPVAMDNNRKTWDNFVNRYWPAHYLIDQNGEVVYTHFGEGEYDVMENNVKALLKISGKVAKKSDESFSAQTAETYLGNSRAERNANLDKKHFAFPKKLALHNWALNGNWKMAEEFSEAGDDKAALRLHFQGKKVFLVMASKDEKPISVAIKLNGKSVEKQAGVDVKASSVKVQESRLYELLQFKSAEKGELEITPSRAGLRVYAFTFGG